jgi:FkbM family methyltransferase
MKPLIFDVYLLKAIKRKVFHLFSRLPFLFLTFFPVYPKDLLLGNIVSVRHNGRVVFKIAALGRISSWRARTFSIKEPETLEWIENFLPGETLLDVGANIGLYSLYAAAHGVNVFAFEPSAQNYALLNLNIIANNFDTLIKAFPVSCHDSISFSSINLSSIEWASALSSFDVPLDQHGNMYTPAFVQGSVGIPLDFFCSSLSLAPEYLKIDVDGNELHVLRGALKLLGSSSLKSILVELNPNRVDYLESIELLQSHGFVLMALQQHSVFIGENTPFNHIFSRDSAILC